MGSERVISTGLNRLLPRSGDGPRVRNAHSAMLALHLDKVRQFRGGRLVYHLFRRHSYILATVARALSETVAPMRLITSLAMVAAILPQVARSRWER